MSPLLGLRARHAKEEVQVPSSCANLRQIKTDRDNGKDMNEADKLFDATFPPQKALHDRIMVFIKIV